MDAKYKEFVEKNKGKDYLYMNVTDPLDPNDFKAITSINLSAVYDLPEGQFRELPIWLKSMPQLEKLDMSYVQLEDLPDWFENLVNLKELNIDGDNFSKLPEVLSKIPSLEVLDLGSNPIKSLPDPNVGFKNLKQFDTTEYTRSNPEVAVDNRTILDWLMHLPKLESYKIPPMTSKYSYGKENPDVLEFNKFFASLCKKRPSLLNKDKLDPAAIKILCWLFRQNKAEMEKADKKQLYSLLNCSVAKYRDMVLEYLTALPGDRPQKIKGKNVFIAGKLKIKKAEYADWLKETGASLQKKWSPNVDFVILGEQPKELLNTVLDSGIPILMEKDVWNIKDSAFLKEEAPVMTENLQSLLDNEDPSNVAVGLTIMEKGGMPRDLLESVIGIMLCHKDSKIRKKAKVIFERYNEQKFPESTQKLLAKSAYRIRDDKKVTTFLRAVVEGTSLDLDKLAYTVYVASAKEQAQGLCLMMPESCKKVLDDYIEKEGYYQGLLRLKPHTRLDNGLYLEHFPSNIEEFAKRPNAKLSVTKDTVIKEESEYLRLKGIVELKIEMGSTRKIPENIFNINSLKKLDFTSYSATKLPRTIGNLQNLEELRMYGWAIKKLPKEMNDLPMLKDLTFSINNSVDTIPDFIFKQTELEKLYFGNKVKAFPKAMEALKKLRSLSIELTDECPPEDRERRKKLTK